MRAGTKLNFDDAITRWSKWNKGSQGDALRILGPSLQAVCIDVDEPAERALEWLKSQAPEAITEPAIRAFAVSVSEIPVDVLTKARARMAEIEKELTEKPLSARDKVLLERHKPLSERSRQSIEDELFECNMGRTRDGVELRFARCGYGHPHYDALTQELDRRDYEGETGEKYTPPSKQKGSDTSYLPALVHA
jgi:hypothetical protein